VASSLQKQLVLAVPEIPASRARLQSEEVKKNRRSERTQNSFVLFNPIFLTSDPPIFAGLMSEDERQAFDGLRPRSTAAR